MYVLLWRTVYALTRVLFWCLFPSLFPKYLSLSWGYKQFVTRVHALLYMHSLLYNSDIITPGYRCFVKTLTAWYWAEKCRALSSIRLNRNCLHFVWNNAVIKHTYGMFVKMNQHVTSSQLRPGDSIWGHKCWSIIVQRLLVSLPLLYNRVTCQNEQ